MEYVTLTFAKKVKNQNAFQFSGSSMPMTPAKTFIPQNGRCEAAAAVFALWPTLTYFCHCDTHLNNGLRPPSSYTAVVHSQATAAFLVCFALNFIKHHKIACQSKADRPRVFSYLLQPWTWPHDLSGARRVSKAINILEHMIKGQLHNANISCLSFLCQWSF